MFQKNLQLDKPYPMDVTETVQVKHLDKGCSASNGNITLPAFYEHGSRYSGNYDNLKGLFRIGNETNIYPVGISNRSISQIILVDLPNHLADMAKVPINSLFTSIKSTIKFEIGLKTCFQNGPS